MRFLLFIFAAISFLLGLAITVGAKTSIHEIQGFILFLISAVYFSGAGIVEAINALRKESVSPKSKASEKHKPKSSESIFEN